VDETTRIDEALFRHAILGPLLCEKLSRGQLRQKLRELSDQTFYDPRGQARALSWRTLEGWYYQLCADGFDGLKRRPRQDKGTCRALSPEVAELVIELKDEDPGRSSPLILRQLELAGRIREGSVSPSTIQRLLRRRGLSGPQVEVVRRERFRFQAAAVNQLWQGDALHGPKLTNPRTGQLETVKVFALIDDRSRLIVNIQAGFRETEAAFLAVLHGAVARRGCPRTLYLDNGSSFVGRDLRIVCAKLGIHLVHSCPYESAARGKIERAWRTLREQLLDRLDLEKVRTLDQLNVRLLAWVDGEYSARAHGGLDGRTPREVWDEGVDDVRWIEDHSRLEEHFRGEEVRRAKNDATVTFEGRTYEVPGHLRRQAVTLRYSCLDPSRVWAVDGAAEIPLKIVDAVSNATRRRRHTRSGADGRTPSRTGLNPVEQILAHVSGRPTPSENGGKR